MSGVDVTIYGDGQAVALATSFIRAGDGGLKDQLYDAIRKANAGVEMELRASAISHLPRRNGLAEAVARARINVGRAWGDSGVGIKVTANHEYDLQGLDNGGNVHPLFGNKSHWYFQHVRAGWFTDVMDRQEIPTRIALERAVKAYVSRF
jgi:hypothetical protein